MNILNFLEICEILKISEILNFKTIFFFFNLRILKIGKPRPERVVIFSGSANFGLSGG